MNIIWTPKEPNVGCFRETARQSQMVFLKTVSSRLEMFKIPPFS